LVGWNRLLTTSSGVKAIAVTSIELLNVWNRDASLRRQC
jgi:hypothetical protein